MQYAKPNFSNRTGGYQAPGMNMGGPGNPGTVSNTSYRPQYSGQSPYAGRYRPPMMRSPGANDWYDQGGYDYNLPNSYGPAQQYGEFNSPDYPGYGSRGGWGRPRGNPGYERDYGRRGRSMEDAYAALDQVRQASSDGWGNPNGYARPNFSGRAAWGMPGVHDPNGYPQERLKPMQLTGPDPAADVASAGPEPYTDQGTFERAQFGNGISRPMFARNYESSRKYQR